MENEEIILYESGISLHMDYLNHITGLQNMIDIANSPAIQAAVNFANSPAIQPAYQNSGLLAAKQLMESSVLRLSQLAVDGYKNISLENIAGLSKQMSYLLYDLGQVNRYLDDSVHMLLRILEDYRLIYCYPDDMPDEEAYENEEINSKIVTKIFTLNRDKEIILGESSTITVLPINENILKYLSEHPEAFYQLSSREFEMVMAEIYSKLGYKVELTKATCDGGKDIVISKPDILGDFIYYVECKRHVFKNPIGVGIVREFVGTINTDKVNGGILATTSYFTPDAKSYIIDNKYNYQIKLHDYNKIKEMLKQIV